LLGRATKILGEFPARKVFLARKSLVVTSWLGARKVNGTFFYSVVPRVTPVYNMA
jgi:hypothetical protein